MNHTRLGFIGWRGMVGSVLLERMLQENDFLPFETTFFSSSQFTSKPSSPTHEDHPSILKPPSLTHSNPDILNAHDISLLKPMDVIVTCQGGDYT